MTKAQSDHNQIDPEFARIVRRIYTEGSKGRIEMQEDVKAIVDAITRENVAKFYGKTPEEA